MDGLPQLRSRGHRPRLQSSNDCGHGPGSLGAERINNRHKCGFSLTVGNDNDIIGQDRNVRAPAAHDGPDVYRDFPLLSVGLVTEYHGLSGRGQRVGALSQRDSLAKRRSFLQGEGPWGFHLTGDEEDIRWWNVN